MFILTLAFVVSACGAPATASPSTSPEPLQTSGSGTPGPNPTRWPGTVVLAIIKMGEIDGEIAKAGKDLAAAADTQDVAAMRGAADGLIPVIKDVQPSVDPLLRWDRTKVLAGYLQTAYPLMLDGATQLRDALTAGDAAGVEAGSQKLAAGLNAYAPARALLVDLVPEALLQKRNFNL
ncbi:MAG: hypothetical protein ABI573_09780 [Chloroflexota bacterium]